MAVEFREVSQALLNSHAGQYGDIRLASGRTSPIYFDLGTLISHPDDFDKVIAAYSSMILSINPLVDRLIDVPRRSTPLVTGMMIKTRIPMISPILEPKDHGIPRAFYGESEKGQRGLVIDDLVTTGTSMIPVVEHSRKNGLIIEDALIFIKRDQEGIDALANIGVNLHFYIDVPSLVSDWREHSGMTEENFQLAKRVFNF